MSRQEAASRRESLRRAALGAWTAVILAAIAVLSWHFTRNNSPSISGLTLCAGATFASVFCLAVQIAFHASQRHDRQRRGELIAFLLTLLPPFVPATVLSGGQSAFTIIYLSALFVGAFIAAWLVGEESGFLQRERAMASANATIRKPDLSTAVSDSTASIAVRDNSPADSGVRSASARPPELDEELTEYADQDRIGHEANRLLRADPAHNGPPESVLAQWMQRTKSVDGTERIDGSVQVEFAPGQKQAVAHVPFVPPFSRIPEVECHVNDVPEVRIKIGTAQMYGARLEARRSEPADEAISVEVNFSATVKPLQSNAV